VRPGPSLVLQPATIGELRAGLRQMHGVFTGREPAEVRTGVVPIGEDRVMVTGSTAPAIHSTFVARASGLLVPASAVPTPLNGVVVYITGEELFGVPPSPEWTVDELRRTPFAGVLDFVAGTLAVYRNPGVGVRPADRQFAERWLAGDALVRARNLLRDPSRRLVVPQGLFVLAKLAAFHSPDAVLPGVETGRPHAAVFGALTAIDTGLPDPADVDLVVDTDVGEFASHMVANQHFNHPGDEVHLMARFVRQWLQLPGELAADRQVVDLPRLYREVTGAALDDVLAVGVLLWAAAVNGTPRILPDGLAGLGWDTERLEAVLRLFVAEVPTLRVLLQKETVEHGLIWAFSRLGQYPVVRLDDGALLVLDMQLLCRRLFGGLTIFDITAPLDDGGPEQKKLARRVRGCVAHLAEVYALEVLASLTASGPACRRVFDDAALQRAYRRKGRRIADAAVDYGDAWVVAEVTTTTLKRESVAAVSTDALSADLDKLVDEVEQIDHTIAALRADETRLTGAPAAPTQRFYPLLVVADGFPVNPITVEWLRQRVTLRGLLTGPDTAPLEIVDTVELEMLEGLAECGGPSLCDVLAGKEHAHLYRTSLRDYLIFEAGHVLSRPRRVDDLMDRAWQPARRAAQAAA